MIEGLLAATVLAVAASSQDGWLTGVVLLLVVSWIILGLVTRRLYALRRTLHRIETDHTRLQAAHTALVEHENKAKSQAERRREELAELKQDVATQRKKNHTQTEELRKLREALKEETRLRQEAQNSRPAFADAPERPAPRPKPVAEVKPEPVAPSPPQPSAELVEARRQNESLENRLAQVQKQLEAERTAAVEVRTELKKQRKRSEDFRRIDIITKSKMELLEDKLRHIGRAYYDVISELAALKGEVVPPKPRDLPPEREPPSATDDDDIASSEELADNPRGAREPAGSSAGAVTGLPHGTADHAGQRDSKPSAGEPNPHDAHRAVSPVA